jgi:hypothetical protein
MFRKLHDPGPDAVTISIDGVAVAAELGETVAAVLLRQPMVGRARRRSRAARARPIA